MLRLDLVRYWPNPAHKRSTTEAGVGAWRPAKEPCPAMTIEERDALLQASLPEDGANPRSRRYAFRRTEGGLEFFEARWTRDADGEPEFHGYPTRHVPVRVLRALVHAGAITRSEYERLRKDLY